MKILVINLDRRADRLERIRSQLGLLPMEWRRIRAIDGLRLKPSEVSHLNSLSVRPLGRGELGCALSHIKAWRRAMNDRHNGATWILEDDVTLLRTPRETVSVLEELERMDDWDLMYTTGVSNTDEFFRICEPAHLSSHISRDVPVPAATSDGNIAFPVGPQLGAYSYLLSRKGLRKVHSFFRALRNPVDVQLGEMNRSINTYMLRKALVAHTSDGTSDTRLA